MKIVCTQENLKNALNINGKIISPSNTLPILNNVLIKTESGGLKLYSTNLEIAIITQIRCKVEEEGSTTVASKVFSELVNNLPNKNLLLQTENNHLNLEAENYHTTINTLPEEDFPLIPQVENGISLKLDAQELKNAILQVVFAASLNQTQAEICGLLLAFQEGGVRIAATDRYRLAEKKITTQQKYENKEVIIPQKTAHEVCRIIGSQKGDVEVIISDTQAQFSLGDTQIISRLTEGQYPDYQQIIPTEFATTTTLEKQGLVSALRAGGIFSTNSNSINFLFSDKSRTLTITSQSQELGKSQVTLSCEGGGNDIALVLNYHYVLDCLQAIQSERVQIKIVNDSSPTVFLPEGKSDYTYLVMPIKS